MNHRSAAREIMMLAIPQLPKDIERFDGNDFDRVMLSLVRSLTDYAKKNISSVSADLKKIEKFLNNAEIEHPDNEQHTSNIEPVLIPDTKVLKNQISAIESAATELFNALDIPELVLHVGQEKTKEYLLLLYKTYIENKGKVNEIIEQAAQSRKKEKKWKVERMVRLDRDILRIATTELIFFNETPTEVICDEAVKIAEKYGGDESKKFVNGILGDVVYLVRSPSSPSSSKIDIGT